MNMVFFFMGVQRDVKLLDDTLKTVFIIKLSHVIFPIVLPSSNLLNGLLCRKEERQGLNSGNSGRLGLLHTAQDGDRV